jgi:rubrerythrin
MFSFYKLLELERRSILNELLSKIPIDLDNVDPEDLDKEILRASIISELDAINLYEQMANVTNNDKVAQVLLDVAKEEKTHVGEFQALLEELDTEHEDELESGKDEVENLGGGE